MNQNQSIGSNNQQQGLPNKANNQTMQTAKSQPNNQQEEKPAVTDDEGNQVNRLTEDAGNGYSERKHTEAYSDQTPDDESSVNNAPENQDAGTEKVYGDGVENGAGSKKEHAAFTNQANEEKEHISAERIRQAEEVRG